jgi:hypothetical protein
VKFIWGAVALVFLLVVGGWVLYVAQPNEVSVCTVTDKSATKNSDSGTDYRIYTEDCGTFAVSDTFTRWDFRSADRYGEVKIGERYKFTHYGFRNGPLSMFPNIIDVEPAP